LRITVIATGFDETRARLSQMAKTSTQTPIQGVISEAPEKEEEKTLEDAEEENSDDKKDGEDDTFGEKFEIPAFLRKGR